MKAIDKTVGMVKNFATDIKDHWKTPKEGEYVSYKEFGNFILGAGISSMSAGGNLSFTAGCLFVGAIYGIKMMDFAMLGIVGMILNYLFQPFGMIMTDNLGDPPKKTMRTIHLANLVFTIVGVACFFVPQKYFENFMPALPQIVGTKFLIHVAGIYYHRITMKLFSKKFGKYRSWIVAGLVPYIAAMMFLVWFPFGKLDYSTKFWVMHLVFSFWGIFGGCLGQQNNLQNVMSPNTNERAKIMSYGSFAYSLFPSITNVVFPACAALVGGMTDIRTYRIIIPIFVILFAPSTLFLAFGVKDRVVQEHDHKPQVDMKKGFREVLRNKYLWINNISGWLGAIGAGAINVINMLIIYQLRQDWVLGLMATLLGTAYTPGMLLAPLLLKKFGKKSLVLACKYSMVICSILSVLGVYMNSLIIIIASTYISTMFASLSAIVFGTMNADIWDYQQYISGERLDGCMGIFGYLSTPITTFAGLFIPTLYGMIGFTSDWNILYDAGLRNKVFLVTLSVGVVTGLLSTIPYHFYDLTEEKHKGIVEKLRVIAEEKENHTEKVTE